MQVGAALNCEGELSFSASADGIYLAYRASGTSNAGKLMVRKLQDGVWRSVGSQPVSTGDVNRISICSSGSSLFVAYAQYSYDTNDSKLTVKSFQGSSWTTLGTERQSAYPLYCDPVIRADGQIPYVAYIDGSGYDRDTNQLHVIRYKSGAWENVGGENLFVSDIVSMDLDKGMPYIAFSDRRIEYKATVLKYNGEKWIPLGEPGVLQSYSSLCRLDVVGGVPYLACDRDADYLPAVFKFQSTADATLSGIALTSGKLTPAFQPAVSSYTVEVTGTTAYFTLTPVAMDSGATVLVNGKKVPSNAVSAPIPLAFGNTAVTIVVTSRDGTASKKYTVTVHRPYSLYLAALALNQGALEPGFDIANTTYTVNLNPSAISLGVKPTFSDKTATVTINGKPAANGAVNTVPLNSGKNKIAITATSLDRSATKTYTLYAYRHTGTWQKLGGAVKIDGNVANPALTFLGGVPYVANCADRVFVSKFDGTVWSALPQVTGMNSYATELGIKTSNGVLYTAIGGGRIGNLVVYKYTKNQWKWASPDLVAKGCGSLVSLGEYKGMLYLAYTDDAYENDIVVKKYSGSSWVSVGPIIATPGDYTPYAAMDIDPCTGTPYVAYEDDTHIYVKKYNGSSWVSVGGTIAVDIQRRMDLSVYNGIAYVANANGVYKLDGSTWKNLGRKLVVYTEFDLGINKGVPYIVFNDVCGDSKITLQKYNGNGWENVGTATSAGQRLSLQFYNDTPYISFVQMNNAYVIKYVQATNASLSSISVKSGSTGYALSPKFNATTFTYSVSVPYSVSRVTVAAKPQDAAASLSGVGAKTLSFGLNTIVLTAKSGNGAVTKTYTLKITRAKPPQPSISAVAVTPSATYGFTPGGTNTMQIKATIASAVPATVTAYIYNSAGKWVAALTQAIQAGGVETFVWDGKATPGNAAHLTSGAYVPASASGTAYTVKVVVCNGGGSATSASVSRKLYSSPAVSGFAVEPAALTAVASGANKTKISYQVNHLTNVEVRILNSQGKTVALFARNSVAPNVLQSVYWDGKATAGNTAGLGAGALVPAGQYTVQIVAGNTTYRPTAAITVKS